MAASHFVDAIDQGININYCFKENAHFSNNHLCSNNIRGGLMVSALDSESSGPGSGPSRGHCVVFLGKTLYSHGASLNPGV